MSSKRVLRTTVMATTIGIAGLLGSGVASAHVTANIYGSEPQRGGSGAIVFRVPNEEADAGTTKLEIDFKQEYAISSVRYKPIPGWTAEVTKTQLPAPVKNGKNLDVSNPVTKVVFTAQPGGGIAKGDSEFQEFELSVSTLPSNVDELVLPAIQTYDNGQVVNWDQVQNGSEEPEHPAPTVTLAAASTTSAHDGMDMSTAEAPDSDSSGTDSTARWLGGAGLVVGALGLGFGAGATLRARKAVKK